MKPEGQMLASRLLTQALGHSQQKFSFNWPNVLVGFCAAMLLLGLLVLGLWILVTAYPPACAGVCVSVNQEKAYVRQILGNPGCIFCNECWRWRFGNELLQR